MRRAVVVSSLDRAKQVAVKPRFAMRNLQLLALQSALRHKRLRDLGIPEKTRSRCFFSLRAMIR